MGFRSDMILGYQEVEEDRIFFNNYINYNLLYLSADKEKVKINLRKQGNRSLTHITLLDKEMTFKEFKDKLEEYYGTRDLMILKENMSDFISRIRREENDK